jgi:hypothetical protein
MPSKRAIKHGKKVVVFETDTYGDKEIVSKDVVGHYGSDHRVVKEILPTNREDSFVLKTTTTETEYDVLDRADAAALAVELADYESAQRKVYKKFEDLLGPSPFEDEEEEG